MEKISIPIEFADTISTGLSVDMINDLLKQNPDADVLEIAYVRFAKEHIVSYHEADKEGYSIIRTSDGLAWNARLSVEDLDRML